MSAWLSAWVAFLGMAGGHGVPADAPCVREPQLEQWLAHQQSRWVSRLAREPGYAHPAQVSVCRLRARRPYTDIARGRIFANALRTENDEVAFIHEYLHLALRDHPRSGDENYIETLARELAHGAQ
ncbi:DUF2300 domain-containing protein [Tahibacter amnicola]|uniref:DUF2300 domain-containing protein n=1 Tax=Tahibacter amnicola TaxID=2976241 RepID=A0ABY6BEB3_9GAMM|nr:DUF2300 domain-containing protein [Tahibacter amnicola]UXI67588.1 DUF2300 domain-containing protein [Tahibacter amnicola]